MPIGLHIPKGVHPAVYLIITAKFATYTEIKNMSIDDFINLYEIAMVSVFNKSAVMGDIKKSKHR